MDLHFVNGKATIKESRRIIAKIFDRAIFFAGKVSYNERYPYSIEMHGMSAECETLEEVIELYYSEL